MENNVLKSQRLVSLDAIRGFIMFTMLLHTFGLEPLSGIPFIGFIFTQLNHASWEGFHFEDVILPTFLFIIGFSMGLSDLKRIEKGEPYRTRLTHAIKRSVSLFIFGFILSWIQAGKPTFGPGVLQVLALSYFGAFLFVEKSVKAQFYIFAALLFIYWFFIFVIPVPEAGRNSYVLFKNLVYLIDDKVTGAASRWGYLYTIITSIAVVMYGSIVAKLYAKRKSDGTFIKILAVLALTGILAGLLLNPFIPIIKRMFTPSYTLLTCGLASVMFIIFYWLIDIRGISKWSFPFIVIGMNSIFIYLLHNLLNSWFLETSGIFINPLESMIGAWIHPLTYAVSLFAQWLVCYWLYKRKIYFKL
ncbi:acyltransferase family protein [Candidatus Latescibacterota bacterium]